MRIEYRYIDNSTHGNAPIKPLYRHYESDWLHGIREPENPEVLRSEERLKEIYRQNVKYIEPRE